MNNKLLIVLALSLYVMGNTAFAANKRMNLLQAYEQSLIQFKVERTDQVFKEKGLKMVVTNLSKDPLMIKIDPALFFESEDSSFQDLIIMGDEQLYVAAGRSNQVELQTFCAKSYARSPLKNLVFTYAGQKDSNMIKTLTFIKRKRIDLDIAQNAVWFFTDSRNDLSSVYDGGNEIQSIQMIEFLSKLTGLPLPYYYTERNINSNEGELVRSVQVLKLHVKIQWDQPQPEQLSLSIYNATGEKIASYFENKEMNRGRSEITAQFKTELFPKGTYTVRLYRPSDGTIVKGMEVPLE